MKPEEVVAWRDALVRLSDQYFFDLVRMYLGAVKTPFNKQRIVEELSAFIRKKERRDAILVSLDDFDLMILSAIAELPSPTQQKIVSLFSRSRGFPEIYDRILNLEERLVIYRTSRGDAREYAINPLLKDDIEPLLGFSALASPDSPGEPIIAPLAVDDLSLAALYGFFLHAGESVKNDGTLKKKTREALEASFPNFAGRPDCAQLLLAAFQNLGLLVILEGNLVPDPSRWQAFAQMGPIDRAAWLVAAAAGRLSREALQRRAQLFLDFRRAMDPAGRYRRETVSRLAFLLAEKAGSAASPRRYGRFATMLRERAAGEDIDGGEASAADADGPPGIEARSPARAQAPAQGIPDVAFAFGLLVEADGMWAWNSAVDEGVPAEAKPSIVVSPAFAVTLMPGFTLADLLPLASCMETRDVQIVARFEITRRSCSSAFEQGETAKTVERLLKDRSALPIPQNVLFSIDDWYRGYSSISLYHGYVLRVDEGRRALFENNEHLSALILRTLAPGVYLLDAGSQLAIQEAFAAAGLESPPSVSNLAPRREPMRLPPLSVGAAPARESAAPNRDAARPAAMADRAIPSAATAGALRETLYSALEALTLDPDVADALRSRIDRRIALDPAQLDPDSVRVEKVEARGMDFLGKVRIAEYAISSGALLEIAYDEREGSSTILGRPISTEKRTGDVLLKIVAEPDRAIETVSIGKAILVRRIRGSIFSELPQGRG